MNIQTQFFGILVTLLPLLPLKALEPFSLEAHCLATIVSKRNEITTPPLPVPDNINYDLTLLNRARVNRMYYPPQVPAKPFNEPYNYLTDALNVCTKTPTIATVPSLYSYALAHVLSKTIPLKTMQSLSLLCNQDKKPSSAKFHINGNIITNMVVLETLLLSHNPQERFDISTDLIHQACRQNYPMPLIKLLATRNPQKLINTVFRDYFAVIFNQRPRTLIEHAVDWNRIELVRFLLSHGALVRYDGSAWSPLTVAAENNHVNKDIIFALLDAGADFTGGKFSPLNTAQQRNNKRFIDAVAQWQESHQELNQRRRAVCMVQ